MHKLEYIWIDGTEPTAQVRSKTKVVGSFKGDVKECPEWNFDGSSTNQAEGNNSDCVLKPVRLYENPMEYRNPTNLYEHPMYLHEIPKDLYEKPKDC